MQEEQRLQELLDYHVLDTNPEKDLDELAQIASAVCNTPMSLITFIDSHRQWYKAKKGVDANEVRRSDSFCQFLLDKPHDVMVVADPLTDERFKTNRYVIGAPYIRFYAGAPLTSPNGNVLGTLCVMDSQEHDITEDQKIALQLLAKKAMQHMDMRKTMIDQEHRIEYNAGNLKKLTDRAPGTIFQLEASSAATLQFTFISEGIQNLHPQLKVDTVREDAEFFFGHIHDEDRQRIRQGITRCLEQLQSWNEEFRIDGMNGVTRWFSADAIVEKREGEKTTMYGSIHDISSIKKYAELLNEILHDVSHVMRRPIASMLGLVSLMEKDVLDADQLRQYMTHVKNVFSELDTFTRRLNKVYTEKRNESEEAPHHSS